MTNAERRERVNATVSAIGDVFVIPESGGARMAGRVAYFHVVHLRDLFDGVVLLVRQARAHGAFILGRSMFESTLMLGALDAPTTRDGIAARWFYESQHRAPKLISALAGAGKDVTGAHEVLSANDRTLNAGLEELGLEKLPPPFSVDNEARRQRREEDLPNNVTAHAFTHGAYSALKYRVVHDGERSTYHLTQAHNPELLEVAANYAGRSALLGYRSFCRIFEMPEPESLPRLFDLIEFADADADAGDVEGVE